MCNSVDSITYILFSTPAIRPQPVFTRPSPECRPPSVPFLFRTKQARPAEWGNCHFLHTAPYSSAQGKFVHVQCIKRNKGIHFLQYPPFLPPPHSIIWVTIKPVPGICISISSSISDSIYFCSLAPFLPHTQSGIWVTIKPVPASSTQDTKVTHPFLLLTPSLIFVNLPSYL